MLLSNGQLVLELNWVSRCEDVHNLGPVVGTNVGGYLALKDLNVVVLPMVLARQVSNDAPKVHVELNKACRESRSKTREGSMTFCKA